MNTEGKKKPLVPKHFVVIGTSGSQDYLKDTPSDRRFWPIRVAGEIPAPSDGDQRPLTSEEWSCLKALLVEQPTEIAGACDGLHDEDAPATYLCTRCFPEPDPAPDLGPDEDDEDAIEDADNPHDTE